MDTVSLRNMFASGRQEGSDVLEILTSQTQDLLRYGTRNRTAAMPWPTGAVRSLWMSIQVKFPNVSNVFDSELEYVVFPETPEIYKFQDGAWSWSVEDSIWIVHVMRVQPESSQSEFQDLKEQFWTCNCHSLAG